MIDNSPLSTPGLAGQPMATGMQGPATGGNSILCQIVNTINHLETQVAAHSGRLDQMPTAQAHDENEGVKPHSKMLTVS